MIDVEDTLRDTVHSLVPTVGPADWDDVLDRAAAGATPRRPRPLSLALALAAVISLVLWLTPLGSAIANGISDFSDWISGDPGTPATPQEQAAFDQANARSWLGFPQGTDLRRLQTSTGPDAQVVDLLGFRSGSRLCLRVIAKGTTRGSHLACTPLSELQRLDDPVRVVFIDQPFGRGTKQAWYGLDHIHSAAIQVTAGIAADGITAVTLLDDHGAHAVPVENNTFLYIAKRPEIGQRVRQISATLKPGTTVPITFAAAPAPFGFGRPGSAAGTPTGPTKVERTVVGDTIGWLGRREERGEPLQVIQGRIKWMIRRNAVFGRVLTPDPSRTEKIAVTINHSRRGTAPTGLCIWHLVRDGAGGGCGTLANAFAHGPILLSYGFASSTDQFITASGLASDAVNKVIAHLAAGPSIPVPLRDNAFIVDLPRSALPARFVSYDNKGRVIGVSDTIEGFGASATPAPGKPRHRETIQVTGGTVSLYTGPATDGGVCTYLRYRYTSNGRRVNGTGQSCQPATPAKPMQLQGFPPAVYFAARVTDDISSIELRYTDGSRLTLQPRNGFVLAAIPAPYARKAANIKTIVAFDASGKIRQRENLRSRKHP